MSDERTAERDLASELRRYLQQARDNLVSKLEDLSEHNIRRPMTPSGTNLLGLVKHLIGIEFGYLGDSVGRPSPITLPWYEDGSMWEGSDMWAKPDEPRRYLLDLYRSAWRHSDESIHTLGLTAAAHVAWWPEDRRDTTFGALLVRVTTETAQHAGHADIIREMIDGRGGKDHEDMGDAQWWSDYVGRIQEAADAFSDGSSARGPVG